MHQVSPLSDRVLLVDDDDEVRVALAMVMEQGGYRVDQARSAAEALERIGSPAPAAIVLDVNLPDTSGFELFAQLRTREEMREVPVLFVSGSCTDESHVVRALANGASDYLRRPFGSAEFLARLEVALRTQAALTEMRRLGTTDELTGLPNRRAFYEALERERRRAHREETDLAVVVLDVDRFKLVNDTWGHPTGDRALRAVARVLRTRTRATDVAGRIGGEEFALILPSTSRVGAADLAEKLRREIAEVRVDLFDGRSLSVTASLGIAAARGSSLDGAGAASTLLAAADAALYEAKRNGRDRVEVSLAL